MDRIVLVKGITDARLTGDGLAAIALAVSTQLLEQLGTLWQRLGVPVVAGALADVGPNDAPLVLLGAPDDPGELGDHDFDGRPQGRVFVLPAFLNGEDLLTSPSSVSTTVSHEACELLVDPYVNAWVDRDDGTQEPLEACDRTEGDGYVIATAKGIVRVSNFLGPRAFRSGPGPYDWLRLLQTPWENRGYFAQRGADGTVTDVFAARMPDWKRALKTAAFRPCLRRAHVLLATATDEHGEA